MTHNLNPKISSRQRNIIIGTILGGSSIIKPKKGKNCYLSMRNKDLDWLTFKAKELENLATKEAITKEKTYRWHSICYPLFLDFHKMFYVNESRFIDINVLNLLQDMSIAVWYKDCGKINKNCIIFNTHIWDKQGTQTICNYFQSLEWNCMMFLERGSYRIKLDEKSSSEVLAMVDSSIGKKNA